MKSTAIAIAVAVASLGFGSLAHAQRDGRGDSRDWRQNAQSGQYQQRQYDQRHQQPQYNNYQGQYNHYGRRGQYGHQGQWSAHAPQYRQSYRRGDHLPYQFRQRQYYVNDWRAHRLYAPPYGYQWVQADDGGDFLLVAIASGLIANLLINQ